MRFVSRNWQDFPKIQPNLFVKNYKFCLQFYTICLQNAMEFVSIVFVLFFR